MDHGFTDKIHQACRRSRGSGRSSIRLVERTGKLRDSVRDVKLAPELTTIYAGLENLFG